MVSEARERREAIRQLAGLRRRQAAAEDALADALAAMKQAEGAFDAAEDRFGAAERALDAAREERAQARRDRYTARQAYERVSVTADRLAQRVRELSERLDRAAELGGHAGGVRSAPATPALRASRKRFTPRTAHTVGVNSDMADPGGGHMTDPVAVITGVASGDRRRLRGTVPP